MPGGMRVSLHEPAIRDLLKSHDGPVARDLISRAQRITKEAKRRAPVSPRGSNGRRSGYLRSQISWEVGADSDGVYVDIATPATTPQGAPYGLFQEVGTSKMPAQPHLRPAVETEMGRDTRG